MLFHVFYPHSLLIVGHTGQGPLVVWRVWKVKARMTFKTCKARQNCRHARRAKFFGMQGILQKFICVGLKFGN